MIPNFFNGAFADAVDCACRLMSLESPSHHISLNANTLYWAAKNMELRESLRVADWVTADGASIALAGRLLGFQVRERIAGIDLMMALMEACRRRQWPVALVSPRPQLLETVELRCARDYPDLPVLTFSWEPGQDFVLGLGRELKRRKVKVLFAALPGPLEEIWLSANKVQLGAPLVMGVGGSFEVLAGSVRRAPLWWQEAGLEWLFRFVQEPRRRVLPTFRATFWFGAQLVRWRSALTL